MGQLRNEFVQAMKAEMYDYFFEKYDKHTPRYPEIFDVQPSEGGFEKETTAIMPGELQEKQEDEPIQQKKLSEGYIVYGKNRTFAQEIALSKEAVDDNRRVKDILRKAASQWGEAVALTKERFYAKIFTRGGYTAGDDIFNASIPGVLDDPSGNLCYDNKPFFNLQGNERSSKGGGTYYNAYALTLTPANVVTLYNRLTVNNSMDENDEEVEIIPDTLLVPPQLKFTAEEILKSEKEPYKSTETINVLRNIVDIVVWPFLKSCSTAWALGCRGKGLIAFDREAPIIDFFQDRHTKGYIANIWVRWGVMVDNWRYWAGSNWPTS